MTSITIATDDTLVAALKTIAKQKSTTLEAVAQEALATYVQAQPLRVRRYSFIGIGHSGNRQASTQIEAILEQSANRREGWSLS